MSGSRRRRRGDPRPLGPDGVVLLARAIRGLEDILAAELRVRLGAKILDIDHREVRFRAPLTEALFQVGTADDLFIEVGTIDDVSHKRDALTRLSEAVRGLPLARSLSLLRTMRVLGDAGSMEAIASFLGRRNYSRLEIEDATGRAIARELDLRFRPHEPSAAPAEISWRVHIREDVAVVGLRLAAKPLHRRSYRTNSRTGSLHPPVAFAMAMLGDLQPGLRCLDPCCGAGTILIEARRSGVEVCALGTDIDGGIVEAARNNATRAGVELDWAVADAGQLPLRSRSIDRIVCNPPWGRTVRATGRLGLDPDAFGHEIARVLTADGIAVLLGPTDEQAGRFGMHVRWQTRIHVFGQWASLRVLTMRREDVRAPGDWAQSQIGALLAGPVSSPTAQ